MSDELPFDWTQMPRVLESMRVMRVDALIATDDPMVGVHNRAQIRLIDELLRLPKTRHEEREFETSMRQDDDD